MRLVVAKLKRQSNRRGNATSLCLRTNSLLAEWNLAPFLALLVCFLLLAGANCDKIGGSNEENTITKGQDGMKNIDNSDNNLRSQEISTQNSRIKQVVTPSDGMINSAMTDLDPLAMLREIYLDQNSKTITFLGSGETGQVQKFHPNGRYGRRSVDNPSMEPHFEMGKLVYNDDAEQPLKTMLSSISRDLSMAQTSGHLSNQAAGGDQMSSGIIDTHDKPSLYLNGLQLARSDLEMKKLFKCNYTGLTNLYFCKSNSD